ncbi:MAG: type II toxin-antitoxin system VapB family antitoxin [Verrucomicrobia subdivision 3 bacterium]|nr:type II toxin-antitoxin system VapB family antitoxin [Limisphaerales bacterium]
MPYIVGAMKMTMNIDDALLERVMAATGAKSKTLAIDLALREMDRRAELRRLTSEGLGLSASELKEAFDPASAAPELESKPVTYGRKSRTGR